MPKINWINEKEDLEIYLKQGLQFTEIANKYIM